MDLTQIISPQQLQTLSELPVADPGVSANELEEDLDFYAIMEELILDKLVPLKTEKKSRTPDEPVAETEHLKKTEEVEPELAASADEVAMTEALETLKEPEELDLSQNVPMFWFNAQLFEPPGSGENIAADSQLQQTVRASALPAQLTALDNKEDSQSNDETQALNSVSDELSADLFQQKPAPVETLSKAEPNPAMLELARTMAEKSLDPYYELEEPGIETDLVATSVDISPDAPQITTLNQTQLTANNNSSVQTQGLVIPQSIDSPEWSSEFNQQIVWLGQQKIDSAVIKLNPQEFGPLEVNIRFNQDQASVNFTTHTNQVRDLIEQSLPLLREMMSDQGVTLSQVNIESNAQQNQQRQQNLPQQTSSQSDFNMEQLTEENPEQSTRVFGSAKGLIDYFA